MIKQGARFPSFCGHCVLCKVCKPISNADITDNFVDGNENYLCDINTYNYSRGVG